MKYWFAVPVSLCLLLLSTAGSAYEYTGRSHATAMLLLSDSDQSVKLAGKSIFQFGAEDRELADLLAEVVWTACSDKRQLSVDTLSWLAKAIGKTKQTRYTGLLDYCLSMKKDEKTQGYLKWAKKELNIASAAPFEGGHLDLAKIHSGLTVHHRPVDQAQMIKRFEGLSKFASLTEVYLLLGYPDEFGVASLPGGTVGHMYVRVPVSSAALAVTYKDIGTIEFGQSGTDWILDNAISPRGSFWSKHDGHFVNLREQIAKGNGEQLREVAESVLLANKPLDKDVSEAILNRIITGADTPDSGLADSLVWLGNAVLETGDADHEKKLTRYLVDHGNGPQMRSVAEHLLAGNSLDREVLDAAMERISTSRSTEDGSLADGLAWLCKVMLKSGDTRYKESLIDVSKTAAHKALRKYADMAAKGLG
jgi:hypothetical protein